jgi:hypothetical protein
MKISIISKALDYDIALLCKCHADISNDSYSTVSYQIRVDYPLYQEG